ncbi:hypothetical protein [Chitinophaga sp. CF418]|uniref:hypothetical protein n=1 Tax=Chitinophaga sp. CF418 TaxID=1855287 RepID=UPI00091FFD03|nr:hypothetical protein [Chitinophaga sp. CF418]SHN07801.1 hypothetical protein SAMN05216311_10545 [Chitinophaga sp. CF418]
MKKRFLIAWSLSIGLFSCSQGDVTKKDTDSSQPKVEKRRDRTEKAEGAKELAQFTNDDCSQLLNRLFQSSSFESAFRKNELIASVESVKDSIVSIKIESKESDGLAAGWIDLDLRQKKMVDITDDPEVPVILKYNKSMLDSLLTGCTFSETE